MHVRNDVPASAMFLFGNDGEEEEEKLPKRRQSHLRLRSSLVYLPSYSIAALRGIDGHGGNKCLMRNK